MNPYQLLANAIIAQAALDYREVLLAWSKDTANVNIIIEKKDLEEFFLSGWFGVLSDLNGEVLMKDIQIYTLGKAAAV